MQQPNHGAQGVVVSERCAPSLIATFNRLLLLGQNNKCRVVTSSHRVRSLSRDVHIAWNLRPSLSVGSVTRIQVCRNAEIGDEFRNYREASLQQQRCHSWLGALTSPLCSRTPLAYCSPGSAC
ncbi:hypothetical protein E2C01_000741 [Portunus trituberculatus]|uniref:Uncharacterized protein n=1 Tax=Portunus trituberculatus TaxID=210409 RepID=A0A5B7CKR8_PORTR|nr:hypothetical protein [Portunus trituberculatus]